MSPLEADALPGAGLTPAAERLRAMIAVAKMRGNVTITVTNTFAHSLVGLLERAGEALEDQSDLLPALMQCRAALVTARSDISDETAKRVLTNRIATADAAIERATGSKS